MSAGVQVPNMSSHEAGVEKSSAITSKSHESHIPVPSPSHFRRAGSLKLRNEIRTPRKTESCSTPNQPLRRHRSLQALTSPILGRRTERSGQGAGVGDGEDDLDSERSFGSSCSSLCGHSPFAHNGTTYSARNMKYVFHCSPGIAADEYLTPTQRANRTVKRLRRMLADAQAELLEKDDEISRLTKEIVELRLLKAGNSADENDNDNDNDSCVVADDIGFAEPEPIFGKSGPRFMDILLEERDNSSGAENNESNAATSRQDQLTGYTNTIILPRHFHHSPSLADSGNFEDINVPNSLEKEMERLRQNYDDKREKHNEKVEQLLKIIADSNDRYYDLKPKYDSAVIRLRELEKEVENAKSSSSKQDDLQRKLYLQLYAKQLNSEKVLSNVEENVRTAKHGKELPCEDVADLVKSLSVTRKELENVKDVEFKNDALLSAREAISLWILGTRKVMYRALLDASKLKSGNDAEMTLRFLKTAIFYFLTDTTNSRDHLAAIESILGFSEDEKAKIEKIHGCKYRIS